MRAHRRTRAHLSALACALAGWLASLAGAAATCSADMGTPQRPSDPGLCRGLEDAVRHPHARPLDAYEKMLGDYLRHYCHRGEGWTPDKRVRDTGPFVGTIVEGQWVGKYYGTHNPVWVWYSREMIDWLRRNRPDGEKTVANPEPLPDGAVMVKEMFPVPAAACADVDPINLRPTNGAAIMVRDAQAAHDGWFWGWFGWGKDEWAPDWPPTSANLYPNMGFGQYCTNCHASATDNQTFATLLGTAVIVALGVLFSNSRVGDLSSRLSDTNGRIDAMQQNLGLVLQNMASLIQAESAKLQAGMERIEGVLDARLRHVEEKLDIR